MSVNEVPAENPLRQLFEEIVYGCYSQSPELNDAEISSYVAGILTDFAETEQLYRIRDGRGRPLHEVSDMLVASDPVYGEAYSFPREREVRKHIGDFSLFFAGMFPESARWLRRNQHETLQALRRAGKESYYIVSQFNIFEFEEEAPLFARLADAFDACADGLTLVRKELDRRRLLPHQKSTPPKLLM
ncbi:MAG: hypothetical protein ACRD28_14680 [Acidobacteriaceae bacterium]